VPGLLPGGFPSLRPGWRALLYYLALSAAYSAARWALPGATGPLARGFLFLAVILGVTGVFLALEGRGFASLGLAPRRAFPARFLLGLLAGAAILGASALAARAGGGFRFTRGTGTAAAILGPGTLLFLLTAVNEELAFRGYLFQRLEDALGPRGALVLTALLFAAAHQANPGLEGALRLRATLTILAAGLLLGLAFQRTRSLALPMGLHFGWNWTQGTLLGFGVSGTAPPGILRPVLDGRSAWLTGGAFGLEGGLPCLLFCLIACLILVHACPLVQVTGKKSHI
jgi:hypothetical protein